MIFIFVLSASVPLQASATVPYESYVFDNWFDYVPAPLPYVPDEVVSGDRLGIGAFSSPSDIFVSAAQELYIADTGNNRIVVLDKGLKLKRIIDGFSNGGRADSFSGPTGLFVDINGNAYVCDPGNFRMVAFAPDGELFQLIDSLPEVAEQVSGFLPQKVTVGKNGRVYIIAQYVFQGILTYTPESEFLTFFGMISVRVNPFDWFWERIAAFREQRAQTILYIPMEFNNLDIDGSDFVFATYVDTHNDQHVKKLNPIGTDILEPLIENREKQPLIGDLFWSNRDTGSGASLFVDVKARSHGMYSCLDNTRNRVFTYDSEGNLLYVFGGIGNVVGMTQRPVALETMGDKMLVLDQNRGTIMVYRPTEYGRLINLAVAHRFDGREREAAEAWREILKLDAYYEQAYAGVGKSLLSEGKNKEALEYLKKGNDAHYYSIAYRRYRTEIMKEYSGLIFTSVVVIAGAFAAWRIVRRVRRGKKMDEGVAYDA